MHQVLVKRLGGLSLPRKSLVRLTDCPDMTLDVYRGRKTTIQQQSMRGNTADQKSDNQFRLLSNYGKKSMPLLQIICLPDLSIDFYFALSVLHASFAPKFQDKTVIDTNISHFV